MRFDSFEIPEQASRDEIIVRLQNIILGGKTITSNGAIIRDDLRRTEIIHPIVTFLGWYYLIGEGLYASAVSTLLPLRSRMKVESGHGVRSMGTTEGNRLKSVLDADGSHSPSVANMIQAPLQDVSEEFQSLSCRDTRPRSRWSRHCH